MRGAVVCVGLGDRFDLDSMRHLTTYICHADEKASIGVGLDLENSLLATNVQVVEVRVAG